VLLQGTPLRTRSTKAIAAELAFLPQKPVTPVSTSVRELVSRGRYPHRKAWELHGGEHHRIVDAALQATNLSDLADVDAASLSGGQLQRAWIALVLAQETPVVLLDEPTTYLDLAHQLEVLRLVRDMNRERNATVVMVLHDLNLAARSSDRLIAVANGAVVADGAPWDVITPAVLDTVFGLDASVIPDPVTGTPMVVPAADL
jgi:iron complex transport system ATP-binding protein